MDKIQLFKLGVTGNFLLSFTFNRGSEADNEISGIGNSLTTHFRELDTRLGRWWSIDPEEHELPDLSPYNSMGNNPILHNDENGDIFGVDNLIGAAIGAAIEAGTQMAVNAATGKDVFELDYADIAVEAAVGFATSGVGNIAKSGKTLQRIAKAANNISKAANSNKAIKTVVKASKATGAGKNVIKASFDVKLKDGKLKNESKTKSGSEIAVDIVGGIVGDGFGNVVNDAVAAKVTKQITRQTNKSHKAISKEVANKYAKKVTGSRAKAAAIKAPGSLSFNIQAGIVGDAVKKKISNNNSKQH